MANAIIGMQVAATDAAELLAAVERAEELGVPAVWTTSEGVEALTLFAAAAVRTQRVLMGTAIVRAATRHPVSMAQQAAVIAQLAPRRLRLGIGPVNTRQASIYGPAPKRPLAHLRAYIRAVKSLLETGQVDLDEDGVVAQSRLTGAPIDVPVMASALRRASFELCGAVADGAITWICPAEYVQQVALPAMESAANAAGRPRPPLIMHVPLALSRDAASVRAAIRENFGFYVRVSNYIQMFVDAGFPEARESQWSDRMIDAVAVYGSESEVADRLKALTAMGAAEILVSPVGIGGDQKQAKEEILRFVGSLAGSA
jgi:alkanesulfonate monooxygenase SsuD/methylene tetrahydromethanopterin reductase-like flavin-dependent oxidoreductase (luciferase family)